MASWRQRGHLFLQWLYGLVGIYYYLHCTLCDHQIEIENYDNHIEYHARRGDEYDRTE